MVYQTLDLLLALGLGLAVGWTAGDQTRRRKYAEQQLAELSKKHEQPAIETQPIIRILTQQRGILNDIHKRIMAVSKGLQKQPS